MISQAALDQFYEGLISTVRARGGLCAITSGMACVKYGVAQSTKDCDVLCADASVPLLLEILTKTAFSTVACSYRGHITPPLDPRWLRGGWTSHFKWDGAEATAHLDVFGVAPRASTPWTEDISGLLAGMHTVAEMKRTDRGKDWPFATALGVKLLEAGKLTGWLHIFDATTLRRVKDTVPLPDEVIAKRPALQLLRDDDRRLELAVFGEMMFWQLLNRHRIRVHEAAVREYLQAVKRDPRADDAELPTQHAVRVKYAEELLPQNPLREFGIDRLISEARLEAATFVAPGALEWLPNIADHFVGLADASQE